MKSSIAWLCLLATPMPQNPTLPGIKYTIQHGEAGNSGEYRTYLAPDRKRVESRNVFGSKSPDGSTLLSYGPRLVMITRCDLGQIFELNLDSFEYTSGPYPPKLFSEKEMQARGLAVARKSGKTTLRIEEHAADTGERKEMFGHTARHVVTTRREVTLEGSPSLPQETVTDGWYIDLNPNLSCDRKVSKGSRGYLLAQHGRHPEKIEYISSGITEKGFPLQSVLINKATISVPDGGKKQIDSRYDYRVLAMEEGLLDPALFEIPAGFKLVDHIERNPVIAPAPLDFWRRWKTELVNMFTR